MNGIHTDGLVKSDGGVQLRSIGDAQSQLMVLYVCSCSQTPVGHMAYSTADDDRSFTVGTIAAHGCRRVCEVAIGEDGVRQCRYSGP